MQRIIYRKKKGKESCYYLTVGNEEEDGDFAIRYLEDWKQKELQGERVNFIHIPENGQLTFRMSNIYTECGKHENMVLKIKIFTKSLNSV